MTKAPRYWKPLVRTYPEGPHPEWAIKLQMERHGGDRAAAIAELEKYEKSAEYYTNNLYQVQLRRLPEIGMIHLNIRRRDGALDMRDWRHFQHIKNELVGPENEGIELYPAESRLVDTSNKFHIWVAADPKFRFPIGFETRDVLPPETNPVPGTKQRAL